MYVDLIIPCTRRLAKKSRPTSFCDQYIRIYFLLLALLLFSPSQRAFISGLFIVMKFHEKLPNSVHRLEEKQKGSGRHKS